MTLGLTHPKNSAARVSEDSQDPSQSLRMHTTKIQGKEASYMQDLGGRHQHNAPYSSEKHGKVHHGQA